MDWGPLSANRNDEFSLVRELVGGVGAFLIGYVVIYVTASGAVATRFDDIDAFEELGVAPPEVWEGVAWVFYAAHQVSSGLSLGPETEPLRIQEGPIWEPWFALVPIVLLLVAGYLVARASASTDIYQGVTTGAAILLGYLPMVVVGVVLVSYTTTTEELTLTGGPNLATAALVAGVIYPLVFGGIGGIIAGYVGYPVNR